MGNLRSYLIVDDNVALAENVAEIIADSAAGEAVVASNGHLALQLAAEHRFDAVLSDVRMPTMSGVELLGRMREVDPGVPIALITAFMGAEELVSARDQGVLSILPKPTPIERLLAVLQRARRNGVVALVAQDLVPTERELDSLRFHGFSPMRVASLGALATLAFPILAAVIDFRGLTDSQCTALLLSAEVLPQAPLFALDDSHARSRSIQDPGFFAAWTEGPRLLEELLRLSDVGNA